MKNILTIKVCRKLKYSSRQGLNPVRHPVVILTAGCIQSDQKDMHLTKI